MLFVCFNGLLIKNLITNLCFLPPSRGRLFFIYMYRMVLQAVRGLTVCTRQSFIKSYQYLETFCIFAKNWVDMKIELDEDLKDLIETGESGRYRDVARNRVLYSGLSSVRLDNRYVHRLLFEELDDSITLKLIEIDDTHYGNKK